MKVSAKNETKNMTAKLVKKVKIGLDGTLTFIHDDDLAQMMSKFGKLTITRASDVEPDELGRWFANMRDGTVLGPFNRRDDALKEEVAYLNKKMFGGNK